MKCFKCGYLLPCDSKFCQYCEVPCVAHATIVIVQESNAVLWKNEYLATQLDQKERALSDLNAQLSKLTKQLKEDALDAINDHVVSLSIDFSPKS